MEHLTCATQTLSQTFNTTFPVINVVFSNGKYAFIKDKYEDTNKHLFGCDFPNADYAKIAEAQGAVGFTVDRIEDIDAVVAEAVKLSKEGKTVVIDARITPHRPLPVEVLELDPKLHSEEATKPSRKNTSRRTRTIPSLLGRRRFAITRN